MDIISWFGGIFKDCAGVIYEMCGLEQVHSFVIQYRGLTDD